MRRPRISISSACVLAPSFVRFFWSFSSRIRKKSGSSFRNSIDKIFHKRNEDKLISVSLLDKAGALQNCKSELSIILRVKSAFFASCKESSKETRKGGEECVPPARTFSPSFEPPSLIATQDISFDNPAPRLAVNIPCAFQKSGKEYKFPSPMLCFAFFP